MVKSPEYPHIDVSKLGAETSLLVLFNSNPGKWIPDGFLTGIMGWDPKLQSENCFAIRYRFRRMLDGGIFSLEHGSVYYPKDPGPIITPEGFRPAPFWVHSDWLRDVFAPLREARVLQDGLTAEPRFSHEAYRYFYTLIKPEETVDVQPPLAPYIQIPELMRVKIE